MIKAFGYGDVDDWPPVPDDPGENPRYGPGNPDWEHDREREDAVCPSCDGNGFQAGAHTSKVNPCPTCGGGG